MLYSCVAHFARATMSSDALNSKLHLSFLSLPCKGAVSVSALRLWRHSVCTSRTTENALSQSLKTFWSRIGGKRSTRWTMGHTLVHHISSGCSSTTKYIITLSSYVKIFTIFRTTAQYNLRTSLKEGSCLETLVPLSPFHIEERHHWSMYVFLLTSFVIW